MCAYSEWSNLARSLQQQNKHQGQHMKVHVKGSPPHFQEQVGWGNWLPNSFLFYFVVLESPASIHLYYMQIFFGDIPSTDRAQWQFLFKTTSLISRFFRFPFLHIHKKLPFFNSSLTIGIYKSIVQCCLSVIYVLKYYLVPYSMELDVNLFKASIKLLLDFWIIGEINPFTLRRPCTKSGED